MFMIKHIIPTKNLIFKPFRVVIKTLIFLFEQRCETDAKIGTTYLFKDGSDSLFRSGESPIVRLESWPIESLSSVIPLVETKGFE